MKSLAIPLLALFLGCHSPYDVPNPTTQYVEGPLASEFARTHPRSDQFTECITPDTTTDVTEIALERTGCYGLCSMYTLVLRSNGTAEFHGQGNVVRIGHWSGTIEPYRFHFLAAALIDGGFFEMRDDHQCAVTDNPTVFVAATRNGVRKLLRHYAPTRSHPAHLAILEEAIDAAGDAITWHRASR